LKILLSAKNQAYSFDCDPGEKILHAGLRCGIGLPYECGTGTCGTCKGKLTQGEVHNEWPEAPGQAGLRRDAGEFLMCQCVARTDCSLQVANVVKPMAPDVFLPAAVGSVIRRSTMLTHDVAALEVELADPFSFEAGQFVLMSVPGVVGTRAYSMTNFERKAKQLAFVIKKKPGGQVSEWLFRGGIEDTRVDLFGPLGVATFHPGIGKSLLCIAGGSGIAGMMSILTCAAEARHFDRYRGHVFFGVRTSRDIFFLDELAALRTRFPDALEVTVALSDEAIDAGLEARYPRLHFDAGLIHAVAGARMKGRFDNVRAYAAGPPPMVDATLRMLLLEGRLTSDNIRYDKFS
jgi:toluene monooxygenase electron transfer component